MMMAPVSLVAGDGKRAAVQGHQPFGDDQPQSQSLLFLHFAVELHIGADARDLLGGKSAALIADGKHDVVEALAQL